MTDNEIYYNALQNEPNSQLIYEQNKTQIEFCKNADYLIHDSQYTIEDFNKKIGWGHSNNIALAYFSELAKIKNLVLFHYDPDYSDEMIENVVNNTKNFLNKIKSSVNCIPSKELLEITI